jgi:hypothetical protein
MEVRAYRLLLLVSALSSALVMIVGKATAAPPTPLSACGTIAEPGNYVVTEDLSSNGSCFVLTSNGTNTGTPTNGVSIDLQKHTITGDGKTGSAITDLGTGSSHTVVVNGTIKNFDTGISLTEGEASYGSQVTIDNLTSSGNKEDGVIIGGWVNTVTNSTFTNNGGEGLEIDNCCNTVKQRNCQ